MKDEYTFVKFLLVGEKIIECRIEEWDEEVSTHENLHVHKINIKSEYGDKHYIIPQSAIVLITFW